MSLPKLRSDILRDAGLWAGRAPAPTRLACSVMSRAGRRYLETVAAAVLALSVVASADAGANVVLGARAFAPNGAGWGTAEPTAIFNGGDASGSVTEIHWERWGGPKAIGWGRNPTFKPGGGYYAHPVRIKLRASGLGHCGTRRAYTRLSFREPKRPGGPLGPWLSWSGASMICKAPY